jgi:hypothetical protein
MRELYESGDDLAREAKVMSLIEAAWKCRAVKLSIKYSLDYVLTRGDKAVAFCEVKTRNYSMAEIGQFGGYLLSLGKWMAAKQIAEASGLPFFLIVKTTDAVYYEEFRAGSFQPDGVHVRGRKDRDDWQDIEPCVLLDVNKFKKI